MIIKRRKQHLWYFSIITPFLLTTFILALSVRQSPQAFLNKKLPASLERIEKAKEPNNPDKLIKLKTQIFHLDMDDLKSGITARTYKESKGNYWLALEFAFTPQQKPTIAPDLLLYWQKNKQTLDKLSPNAWLLGSIQHTTRNWFALSTPLQAQQGVFVIYSLAQARVVSNFQMK